MGFIYALVVVLVIFEGIIIQCEGTGDVGIEHSSKRRQSAPNNDLPILPNDVFEFIVSKSNFGTIQKFIQKFIVPSNGLVMNNILEKHTIYIAPELGRKICAGYHLGDSYVTIGSYKGLTLFFEKFGDRVKKIEIPLDSNSGPRRAITHDIVKTYAKNFEELRIHGLLQNLFWDGILSDGENGIIFPELKKFCTVGDILRNEFKLNLIFPKLECFELFGSVADVNCLENVTGLKELKLLTSSIEEQKLDDIFANNEKLTMISLQCPNRAETMHSIAKHLMNLKKLKVDYPGEDFMFRKNNGETYNFPSVTHFHIKFDGPLGIFRSGNLTFDMPRLKELILDGTTIATNDEIVNFIKQFKELETVELSLQLTNGMNCIEELKHIREFRTTTYKNRFHTVKNLFENFDQNSKLQIIKFLNINESTYRKYAKDLNELNIKLKIFDKPTWTVSQEEIGADESHLILERDP